MAAQKLPKRITPAGVAQYPWLNKPDTKFKAEGEYKVTLILSDEDFNAPNPKWNGMSIKELLDAEVEEALTVALEEAKPADKKKITSALPYEEDVDDAANETGNWKMTFKMKAKVTMKNGKSFTQQPIIVDAKRKEMTEPVFGGSVIKVSCQLVPYYIASTKKAGVSLRLIAVQVLELAERVSDGGFDEEEGFESSGVESAESKNDFEDDTDDDEADDF